MELSLERVLTSAELRTLLPEALDGDASPETEHRITDLFAELAGGDWDLAAKAVESFFGGLIPQRGSRKGSLNKAIAEEMLKAFFAGEIDLVEIDPQAQLVWCASRSEKEAA